MSSHRPARLLDCNATTPQPAPLAAPVAEISPYVDGFEAGRLAGHEEAVREFAAGRDEDHRSLAAAARALSAAADDLALRRREELSLAVSDSAALALAVAGELVDEIEAHPNWWLPERLAQSLGLLPEDCEPVVRLCPSDLAVIEADGIPRGVRLWRDETLSPGDCIVDAGPTRVDAGLKSALARLSALFKET